MSDFGTNTDMETNVIRGVGASRTLQLIESGSVCEFDSASGNAFILPAPDVGAYFDFVVTKNVTSNAHKVTTNVGTVFVQGSVEIGAATGAPVTCQGNGTSHTKLSMNGTTTGGLIGTQFRAECLTPGIWNITGTIIGSGSVSTPFA